MSSNRGTGRALFYEGDGVAGRVEDALILPEQAVHPTLLEFVHTRAADVLLSGVRPGLGMCLRCDGVMR